MIVALVFVVAWAAFIVSTIAGGGAGLVMVPLLRTIVPIANVPAALSIGTAASSLSRLALFRRSIRWDIVRGFVPCALPACAVGAWLLTRFEPAYIELLIGCFLLANLVPLLRRRPPPDAAPKSRRWLPAIGATAGLLSGFTGAVGVLFNGAYHRMGLTRDEIIATRATNEILLHLLKLALYAAFGLLTKPAMLAGILVAGAAILASVSARWLLPLVAEGLFRRIGQGAMVAAGAAMFTLSSTQIAYLHQAWLTKVSPEGEHEVQLYWGGKRRLAIELEPEGYLALERSVARESLTPSIRRSIERRVPASRVILVEEVRTPRGLSYEVYHRIAGRTAKIEIPAS